MAKGKKPNPFAAKGKAPPFGGKGSGPPSSGPMPPGGAPPPQAFKKGGKVAKKK